MKLNGCDVKRVNNTIFIRLPPEAWRETDGCACEVCKKDHGIPLDERRMAPVAFWDTLAVTAQPAKDRADYTWTVHYPELYSAAERKAERERRAALKSEPGLLEAEINDKFNVIMSCAERWHIGGKGELARHIWQAVNFIAEVARRTTDKLPVARKEPTRSNVG